VGSGQVINTFGLIYHSELMGMHTTLYRAFREKRRRISPLICAENEVLVCWLLHCHCGTVILQLLGARPEHNVVSWHDLTDASERNAGFQIGDLPDHGMEDHFMHKIDRSVSYCPITQIHTSYSRLTHGIASAFMIGAPFTEARETYLNLMNMMQ
jgi:hypothetical protein